MAKKKKHDIDNDPMFDTSDKAINNAIDRQMVQYLERIERINEEIKGAQDDRKDVFAEAKSQGYDLWTLRQMLALRKLDADTRKERDALIETYRMNCGL